MENLKIMLVTGSVRLGRQSHKVGRYLQQLLGGYEHVETEMLDLLEDPLPMMDERYDLHPDPPESVRRAGERIRAADALILISPEYGGSYPGVLKNLTDLFGRQMTGKAIGVVTTSSGKLGGINASHQLQHLILSMRCYPMPLKLLVPFVHEAFDEQGNPVHPELATGTRQFIGSFLEFARAITEMREGRFRFRRRDELAGTLL